MLEATVVELWSLGLTWHQQPIGSHIIMLPTLKLSRVTRDPS